MAFLTFHMFLIVDRLFDNNKLKKISSERFSQETLEKNKIKKSLFLFIYIELKSFHFTFISKICFDNFGTVKKLNVPHPTQIDH